MLTVSRKVIERVKRRLARREFDKQTGISQNPADWFPHQSGCGPREVARRLRQIARG